MSFFRGNDNFQNFQNCRSKIKVTVTCRSNHRNLSAFSNFLILYLIITYDKLCFFDIVSGTIVVYDETLNHSNYTITEWLLTDRPAMFGLIEGYANPTGVILIILLMTIMLCSMPFVRRGGCFEVTRYISHYIIHIVQYYNTFRTLQLT